MKHIFFTLTCCALINAYANTPNRNAESTPMHIYELGFEFNLNDCQQSWVDYSDSGETKFRCSASPMPKNVSIYGAMYDYIAGKFIKNGHQYHIDVYAWGNDAELTITAAGRITKGVTFEYFQEEIQKFLNRHAPEQNTYTIAAVADLKTLAPNTYLIDHGPAINVFKKLTIDIDDCNSNWVYNSGTMYKAKCHLSTTTFPYALDVGNNQSEEYFKMGEDKWVKIQLTQYSTLISIELISPWAKYTDANIVRPQIDAFLKRIKKEKKDRASVLTTKSIAESDPDIESINGAAHLARAKVSISTGLCTSTFNNQYDYNDYRMFSCNIAEVKVSDDILAAFHSHSIATAIAPALISGRLGLWKSGLPFVFQLRGLTKERLSDEQAMSLIEKYVQETDLHDHDIQYMVVK